MAVTILHSSTTASPASAATAPPSDSSSLNRRSTSSSVVFSSSHPYGGNNFLNRSTISGSPASGILSSPRLASSSPHSISTTHHTGVLPYSPPFGSELRKSMPSSSRAVRGSQEANELDAVEVLDSRRVAGRSITTDEAAGELRRPVIVAEAVESSLLPLLDGDDACWRRLPSTQPSTGYSLSSQRQGRELGVTSSSTEARLTDDDTGMSKYARRTCNSEPPGFTTSATHHRSDRNNGVDYHRRPSATAPQGTKVAAVNGKAQRSRHGVSRVQSRHQLPRLAPSQPQTPSTSSSPGRRRPKSSSAEFGLGSALLLDDAVQQPRRSSSYSSGIAPRMSLGSRAGRLWTPNDPALLNSGARKRAAVRQVGVVMPYEEGPSAAAADDSAKEQPDDDHDDTQGSAADRRSRERRMDVRVRSLPAVVCKSASGDVILMETRNIQNLRIQREYGKEGQRLARSRMQTELSTPRALAADAWRQGHMDVGLITKRPTPADIRAIGERAGWGSELEGMPMEEAQRYMVEARDRVDAYYRRVTEGGAGRNSNDKPSGLRNASGPGDGDAGREAEEISRRHHAKGLRVVHGNSWIAERRSNDAVSCSQSNESTEQDEERGGGANGSIHSSHFDEGAALSTSRLTDHYSGPISTPTPPAPHRAPRKVERPWDGGSEEMGSDRLVCLRDTEAQARRLAMRTERWREATSNSRHAAPRKKSSSGGSSNDSFPGSTASDGLSPDGIKRRGMWKKLQQSAQLKAADDVIGALQRRDAFSLKAAAEERRRRREEIAAEWGREQAREISSLVPPPAELPDEDIPPRSAQLSTLRSRGATATGEQPDPDTTQELKQFEELEAAVAEHEDFHWSGGFGTLSKRRNDGRVVWKAVCDANEAAFDEEQAMELEEQARKTSEAARTLGHRMADDPLNRELQARFKRSVREVHSQRPYFQTPDPGALKVRHRRMPWQRANGEGEPSSQPVAAAWRLEDSIFSQRAKESDAKSFLNTPKLIRMQVEMDWGRVIAKSRFQKMLRKAMGHSVTDDGNHEAFKQALTELEEVVLIRYPTIRSSFLYYCARSSGIGEVSFSLLANQWSTFCRETGITDPSAFCSPGSLNSLFVATNFEEGGAMSRAEDQENDDNALMRFEWVEILIRVAIGKYIHEKRATDDVREAFVMLCDEHLSQLPPEAVLDCNEFRQRRLYTPAVDSLLRGHHSLFKAIFKVYKAKDSAKWFGMEHWVAFLESLDLVGGRGGIGLTHAKLLFMWSQMDVIDELRRRQRVVGWSFTDFLEGIARLADALPLPSVEELEELREEKEFKLPGKLAYWEYYRRVLRARTRSTTAIGDGETNSGDVGSRASSATGRGQATFTRSATQRIVFAGSLGGVDPPSAPLEERLDALLHLMIAGLSEVWNVEGADSARLAEKLGTMATFLSGGIEIGY